MKARKTTTTLTAALISATLLASPFAFAGDKGKDERGYGGKRNQAEVCERFENGDWESKRQQYREKAGERHEQMAERLKLTDEQREIWNEIRSERQQKHQRRFEKMKERCKNQSQE
jgi:Spy/CpxP family protein refolding chaperone